MYANSPAYATVERYDVAADVWHWAPEMIHARCALGVAYSLGTGELFAAGGYGGIGKDGATLNRYRKKYGPVNRWNS